ncbi:M20/M25/M40 family metallo-hydrolase [Intestinimonas sp.]|uniref:M20/M25/M40 family metallo-hydrolase n=1 Tax=Intestinimonas sp. TaxID=1965293 RepID=UPI003AAACD99
MINQARVTQTFLDYVQIDSETHFEREMTARLVADLEALGLPVTTDEAGKAAGSDGANVYCHLEGDPNSDCILFSAHMDTVTPGKGVRPQIRDGYIYSDGTTILGADDKSGIAAILEALRTLLESGVPHRPMDILFTIREEGGLNGSANVDYGRLRAKYGVVLDASNDVGKIVSSAPGQIRIYADIYGRKAHAGSDPEKGVSAIQAAAVAVSRMRLQRIDEETTANIGTLSCVGETNVVQDHVTFAAETRSKSPEKRKAQANHMVACLQEACDALGARLEYRLHHSYQSYGFPDDHPHVRRLMDACRRAGVEPWTTYTGGGTDGNNFNAHGIETVVLACGMEHEHTTQERIAIRNLVDASQVVYQLMLPDA